MAKGSTYEAQLLNLKPNLAIYSLGFIVQALTIGIWGFIATASVEVIDRHPITLKALLVVYSIWEFPKIGDPNILPYLNSRILIRRSPKTGTPNFRKLLYPEVGLDVSPSPVI